MITKTQFIPETPFSSAQRFYEIGLNYARTIIKIIDPSKDWQQQW